MMKINIALRSIFMETDDEKWLQYCDELYDCVSENVLPAIKAQVTLEKVNTEKENGKGDYLAQATDLILTAGGLGVVLSFFASAIKTIFERMNAREVTIERSEKGMITKLTLKGYSGKDFEKMKTQLEDFLSANNGVSESSIIIFRID